MNAPVNLVELDEVSLEFGDLPILRQASLVIEPGERVCLIGRNGAGKSTLMRLITGEQEADAGEIRYRQHLRISSLRQTLPDELDQTVNEHVAGGLSHLQALISEYEALSAHADDPAVLRDMETLQARIEAEGGWHIDKRVETVLSEMELPANKSLAQLSGGWRRRVGLARALVSNPELLLLDEPTNHLDLDAIQWLEDRIRNFSEISGCSVLFITHDRALLQRLATRILELDLARLTSWPGDYRNYLRRKEESLHAERIDKQGFEKKLAEEEAWVRQGIKARRTRNEGRVRALEALRAEAADRARFKRQGKAHITIAEAEQESGRKVIELFNVHHGYGGHKLIESLTLKVMRGDRIGLIGNNGVGKSTLLKIMLGELEPDQGTVKIGTNLEVGYFDQMRRYLDPERTVADIVGDGKDYITLHGKQRHVIGYLKGFLFSAKRAMTPIKALSGGECNRVILARLFTRPTNLLVLDEPTNDLDVETLEVLEQRLVDYRGTLIVVSHDREFLDNVVTSTLVFEDRGVKSYVGGYADWLRQGGSLTVADDPQAAADKQAAREAAAAKRKTAKPKKLSYKLQRELDQLPGRIQDLEREIAELDARIADPDFYEQDFTQVQPVLDELADKRHALEQAVDRWVELEGRTGG